ncbi:hypothetical protein BH10PLA1_BH10PLA1_17890 [soil metagenome]
MSESTTQQLLEQGVAHYRAGRLREAESAYRQVLVKEPDHSDALSLLGAVAFQSGEFKAAIDLIGRAISVNPGIAAYWANLASILNHQKQYDKAKKACEQSLTLKPDYADAHYHLGNALRGKREFKEALVPLREAIKLRPMFPEALNCLGNTLLSLGKTQEAADTYERAIAQRPTFVDALVNLGAALQTIGRVQESVAIYQRAIVIKPTIPEAHSNLGHALLILGQLDDAIAACRKAIDLRPRDSAAFNNLGNALQSKAEPDLATEAFLQSLSIDHNNIKAWNNLGNVQFTQGKIEEAITSYAHAAQHSTVDPTADSNRVYALNFHPHYDAEAILRELKAWNTRRAAMFLPAIRSYTNDRTPTRRLRIGYVSPDFRQHVVGYNLLPLFEQHDRGKFEVYCYSNVANPDSMTDAFKSLADGWRNIFGVSDEQAALMVRDDQIDVLVDTSLHMSSNRLLIFARKPAPVQVTFAGYPGGTGLEAIDYRLTDPYLDPPVAIQSNYVEHSIVLPDSFWCYDPRTTEPSVNELPALSSGHVTFGCLSNFSKINEDVIALWTKVMTAVPNSRLLILASPGSHRDRFIKAMSATGVTADRVEFIHKLPRQMYLEQYHRIDIGLDTFPYNGHTTSLDSLWMGVPVITLVGQTAVSRAGWSQLSNLGLTELAALDDKTFVSIATSLANDLPRLAELRRTLRSRMQKSPLMDAPGFTRNVEVAYRQMWKAWAMA